MHEKRGPRTIAPHFTLSMSKYSCCMERHIWIDIYNYRNAYLTHSLTHTYTETTEHESSSQLPWCTLSTAVTWHYTRHYRTVCLEKVLRQYRGTSGLPVELQPSDESRKERLEAHAIFRNSLHLPLLPVCAIAILSELHDTVEIPCLLFNMYNAKQHILHTQHILVVRTERRPLLENE